MKIKEEYEPVIAADGDAAENVQGDGVRISELSHMNEGATGFNPTAAEMAAVFDGIKAEIEALGGNEE